LALAVLAAAPAVSAVAAAPVVTSVSVTEGATSGKTPVVINGANLTTGGECLGGQSVCKLALVYFGTEPALVSVASPTQLQVYSPPQREAGPVDVRVTTPDGTSATSGADLFTYVGEPRGPGGEPPPVVTGVSSSQGPTSGFNTVHITGEHLLGAASTVGVNWWGVTAQFGQRTVPVIGGSEGIGGKSEIEVIAPPHMAGPVNVGVSTASGSGGETDAYTYVLPPKVTDVTPREGASQTEVTIRGEHLEGASALLLGVEFGGVPSGTVTEKTGVDGTELIAIVPEGVAAGTVDVVVTTPGGGTSIKTHSDDYTVESTGPSAPEAPVVKSVSPYEGTPAGGTEVIITGEHLESGGKTLVYFGGGEAVTNAQIKSAGELIVKSPPHASGTVDVTVTTSKGTSATTQHDAYTYESAQPPSKLPPLVSSVSLTRGGPAEGPAAGGTEVKITGEDLEGTQEVQFGGVRAATFREQSPTEIIAVSPAHTGGKADVTVKTPAGTSSRSEHDRFTYLAPVIGGVSPHEGPIAGGTEVTVTGERLGGATAVRFGESAALGYTVVSSSEIIAVSPPHVAGTVDINITTPEGASGATAADHYTYLAPPPSHEGEQGGGGSGGGNQGGGGNSGGRTSNFALIGDPRVNSKTGAVTFTVSVSDPGSMRWVLTFPNGSFGVVASRKAASRSRCKKGQVKLKGKCRAANVVFGQGSMSVATAGTTHFTVTPSGAAPRALQAALKRAGGLSVSAVLTFDATGSAGPVSHRQAFTVRLKKPAKAPSKHKR
jgi:hypothetical protein